MCSSKTKGLSAPNSCAEDLLLKVRYLEVGKGVVHDGISVLIRKKTLKDVGEVRVQNQEVTLTTYQL